MSSLTSKQLELRSRIERGRTMGGTKKRATTVLLSATVAAEESEAEENFTNVDLENEMVDESKVVADFSKRSPLEKAYHSALDGCRRRGELKPEDDPLNPAYCDNNSQSVCSDLCDVCRKPETEELNLMQCFTDYEDVSFCEKWFHLPCIKRKVLPHGDWICRSCTNASLDYLQLHKEVGVEGFELVAPGENGEEHDTTIEEDEFSGDDNDNDPEYTEHDLNSDQDDDEVAEDFIMDTKPKAKTPPPPPPKLKDMRKQKPVKAKEAPPPKRLKDMRKRNHVDADDVKPKKKFKARAAGARPVSARQQQDAEVRKKVVTIKNQMTILQQQSLPITRSDEYNPDDPEHKALVRNQSHWPWVVHGAFCFTDLNPNRDGSSEANFLEKPELHMWTGSKEASKWVSSQFKKGKLSGFKVLLHTSHQTYHDAFRSDSAKKKEAPPRPTKSSTKKTENPE